MDVDTLNSISILRVWDNLIRTYLLTNVVLVPFQAVIPPPQLRSVTRLD